MTSGLNVSPRLISLCDSMLSMTFGRPSALLSQTVYLDEPLTFNLDDIAKTTTADSLPEATDDPSTTCLFVHTM